MRAKYVVTLAAGVVLAGIVAAWAAEQAAPKRPASPVDVTQMFISGVLQQNEEEVKASFDFSAAYRYITAMLKTVDIDNPWSLDEMNDTIMLYFFEAKQRTVMGELQGKDVEFEQGIDKKNRLALVVIKRTKVAHGDFYGNEVRVNLRFVDGQWRVLFFPEFFPLDAWELTTGVRQPVRASNAP